MIGMMGVGCWRSAWVALCVWLQVGAAFAQEPITNNDFNIDLIATPALGSSRTIGLAGASTAIAEGVDGVPYNPAGYATRYSWERDWWEFEIGVGIQFPGAYSASDYFLNGRARALGVDHFSAIDLAGRIQLGDLGFGASSLLQFFRLRETDATSIDITTTRLGAGYAFLNGQLVIGADLRILAFDLSQNNQPIVSFTGMGAEVGVIIRPSAQRWRIGAALRSRISASIVTDSRRQVAGFWLPTTVASPWEFSAGFAWQWFERPFNSRFIREKNVSRGLLSRLERRWCERERAQRVVETGHHAERIGDCGLGDRPHSAGWWRGEERRRRDERRAMRVEAQRRQDEFHDLWRSVYDSRPRRYVLLTADVLILGRTTNAIGVDAFVRQERFRRGDDISVGLRVGAETEIWPNRLKIRLGTYLEPSRYENVNLRVHVTAGFDLHVFRFLGTEWRITAFLDGARRYFNWGLSIGTWH